jgi:hypothetical protein
MFSIMLKARSKTVIHFVSSKNYDQDINEREILTLLSSCAVLS